jgi:hypothetical protein
VRDVRARNTGVPRRGEPPGAVAVALHQERERATRRGAVARSAR